MNPIAVSLSCRFRIALLLLLELALTVGAARLLSHRAEPLALPHWPKACMDATPWPAQGRRCYRPNSPPVGRICRCCASSPCRGKPTASARQTAAGTDQARHVLSAQGCGQAAHQALGRRGNNRGFNRGRAPVYYWPRTLRPGICLGGRQVKGLFKLLWNCHDID